MKAPDVVMRILREATRLDPNGIELGFGARCTIGVAVPLGLGMLCGRPALGVAAAIGALPVGFAGRQGAYRSGAEAALLTAAGVAVSAFVGGVCGGNAVASVAVAMIWGFAYGVLTALGPTAIAIGVNSVVTLAIYGQFHAGPAEAATRAAFVFAGGAFQTLLLVTVWPLARFRREREVLAAAYTTLSAYAAHFPASQLRAPATEAFTRLSDALADPQPFASRGEIAAFEALLVEAERSRDTLAALVADRRLTDIRGRADVADAIDAIGSATSAILAEIAAALTAARAPSAGEAAWAAFDAPIALLDAGRDDPVVERTRADAEALLGQLRSSWRAAAAPDDSAPARARARSAGRLRPGAMREAFATVRANLAFRSEFAKHGIRLAVVLGVATLAAHALPLERGYWIALTAALVLRNDFATTFTRGVARILGTLAGAVVASTVALVVHPFPATLLVLAVAFTFAAYVFFNVNYALFTTAITGYVIFLLAIGGLAEHTALVDRVDETLIGGSLALCAYALWPTWEHALVPERLAEMLERQRRHAALVLGACVDPASADEAAIRAAQRESWLARTGAESSVDRMLAEPVRPRAITVRAALGVLAASRRFGVATLGLQARLGRSGPVATKRLRELAAAIDASFAILEDALRRHADPEPLPHLRDAQIALVRRLDETADGPGRSLGADTDLMVDSINSIAHVLHRLRDPAARGERP